MRINSVSSKNFSNQANFGGLYRTETKIKHEDYYEPAYEADLGQITHTKTVHYYPFKDESQEQIDEFIKSNTRREVNTPSNPNSSDQVTRIYDDSVILHDRLPMTEEEYKDYLLTMESAKEIYAQNLQNSIRNAVLNIAGAEAIEIENNLKNLGLNDSLAK